MNPYEIFATKSRSPVNQLSGGESTAVHVPFKDDVMQVAETSVEAEAMDAETIADDPILPKASSA